MEGREEKDGGEVLLFASKLTCMTYLIQQINFPKMVQIYCYIMTSVVITPGTLPSGQQRIELVNYTPSPHTHTHKEASYITRKWAQLSAFKQS